MGDANQDGFARQVSIALRVAGASDIEYEEDEFRLRFRKPDGDPMVAVLGNVYAEWRRAAPAELAAEIRRFASTLVTMTGADTGWEDVAGRLRPVLNSPQLLEWNYDARTQVIGREFLPFVVETVVVDRSDAMQYVVYDDPARWGVTEEQVYARARENLAANARWAEPDGAPGRNVIVQMVESGDEYWASHLLLDGWLAAMGAHVGGRPVVFIPDRSGMTIVADDTETVRLLLEATEKQYLDAPRGVSPMAYTVDDAGRVVPYPMPPDGPLRTAVHRAERILAKVEYDAQKEYLKEDYAAGGFTATYTIGHRDDGTWDTVAIWGEGVDTLLPITDFVIIINEALDRFMVRFETVVRILGLAPHPEHYPPRYLTPPWPRPEQLAALRAEAVRA